MARLALGLAALALGARAARPEVTTADGQLQGIWEGEVRAFKGIPYAKPPIGELRWRPPKASEPWAGLRDASAFGNVCMQPQVAGAEDCLFLNVYTPPAPAKGSNLPCLVWIHGGAYEFGAGSAYNASALANYYQHSGQPAVVVSINYRLNAFGFLGSQKLRSRDELGSTGNYGIQDQRLALQWVQRNIAAFGADPKKVMIFGQSAGAGSVTAQLTMAKSEGLFSRALMESGGFSGWAAQTMAESERWYNELLKSSGCAGVDCLLALPATELLAAYQKIPSGSCCGGLLGTPWIPWAPTVDGVELLAHPLDVAMSGKVHKVPVLIGTNQDDGGTFAYNPAASVDSFRSIFTKMFGPAMGASATAERAAAYLQESHPSVTGRTTAWWAEDREITDQNFACTSHWVAAQLAKQGFSVFQYLYAHPAKEDSITYHSDELRYVFTDLPANATQEERELSAHIATYWNRFAADGSPSSSSTQGPTWPRTQVDPEGRAAPYLKLDVTSAGGIQVISEPFRPVQCAFMNTWMSRVIHDAADEIETLLV